ADAVLFGPYQRLLADRELRRIILTSLIARLPIGMNSLAITLGLQTLTGSFATAGVAASAYLLAVGVQAPIIGRAIDTRGPASVMLPLALAHALALVTLVVLARTTHAAAMLAFVAAVAGFCFPPVSMTVRAMYRKSALTDAQKQAAFAIEAILMEICFIVGPLLVSLAAACAQPAYAILFSAALSAGGVWLFSRSGALARWGVVETGGSRHWAGPLTIAGVRRALLLSASFGLAIGLLEIAVTGYSRALDTPEIIGLLFAAMSITSALSGFAYGALHFSSPLSRHCFFAMLWLAAGALILAQADRLPVMVAGCLLAGAGFGPGMTAMNLQLGKLTPSQYSTEAFTWSMTLFMSGLGSGFLAGGLLIERLTWQSAMLASAGIFVVAALVCLALPKTRSQHPEAASA
ncbi:MAG: MFS transporter, partial [Casimicrobiaceae bacterium]